MYAFLLLIGICSSKFQIWSPDELSSVSFSVGLSSFGDGSLVSRFGKLLFIQNPGTCSFVAPMQPNSFALLYNFTTCNYIDLAQSVQSSGGSTMIYIAPSDDLDFLISASDPLLSENITILLFSLKESDGMLLKVYSDKEIWASYSYDLHSTVKVIDINYKMTSNYTIDKAFISVLNEMASRLPLGNTYFSLSFCYLSSSAEDILNSDCLTTNSKTFCLPHTSTVTGAQKINNTLAILNYKQNLNPLNSDPNNLPTASFLSFLMSLYTTCEFNYTSFCIGEVLSAFNGTSPASVSFYYLSIGTLMEDLTPSYYISNNHLYWIYNIEQAYCLSVYRPPSACTQCSSGCSYLDLRSPSCIGGCNSTSCGNDNLKCMGGQGCYLFMLGDGNCNALCPGDPDCPTNPDVCAPGCLYSDMSAGECPSACSGFCFLFCASDYCSPGCSYTALGNGACPVECTSTCFQNCSEEYCSPGCLHSDLAAGICSRNCTEDCLISCVGSCTPGCSYSEMARGNCPGPCSEGSCFKNCSPSYCSPGCSYADMAEGQCPVECTGQCFGSCSSLYCGPGCLLSEAIGSDCSDNCLASNCCTARSPNKWLDGTGLVILIVCIVGGAFM